MSLITPDAGLIIWSLFIFGILFFLLAKYAWKPIIASLSEREQSIEDAISLAAKTRQEMLEMKAGNEKLLAETRAERDAILKQAKEISDKIVADAKTIAQTAASQETEKARVAFEQEKNLAVASLRKEAAKLSIEIAEKVLRNQLADKSAQEKLVSDLLADVKLN
ncbi:MAG: F0F1 ATP synthase subunit B [Pseudarcicella sp.]|nr:F0F1 ATP synthase subunit B [Pseudarcicella sp.]MBP6409974.1 F0F1 ATP synthase subunit B [Pseudarcicella sp.]